MASPSDPPPLFARRRLLAGVGGFVVVAGLAALALRRPFPSDHTPEGAWLRIALAIHKQRLEDAFAYLETEAQWASFSIGKSHAKALSLAASFPVDEQAAIRERYTRFGSHPDGPEVFAAFGKDHHFETRLKKDLSGVGHVEIDGERATVVTARGTRHPFRRRENGIWGLTIFTGELLAESRRAARDLEALEKSAADFARLKP